MKLKHVHQVTQSIRLSSAFRSSRLRTGIRASILGVGLTHCAAHAATITVDTNADNGAGCTLRDAIASATSGALSNGCVAGSFGVNTIVFSNSLASSNTINLSAGELEITNNMEIKATTIDGGISVNGNSASSVFDISGSAILSLDRINITGGGIGINVRDGASADLRNSTISGNSEQGVRAATLSSVSLYNSSVKDNFSSGIYAGPRSSVTLINSSVSGNSPYGIDAGEAAVFDLYYSTVSDNSESGIFGDMSDEISLVGSTVSGNQGHGILLRTDASIDLSNSTVSGNSLNGIFVIDSRVTLNNSTVSNNSAAEGGGVFVATGSRVNVNNSIIANSPNGSDCAIGPAGEYSGIGRIYSDSATIIGDASCAASRSGDPGLLALANNGGRTKTHALMTDSIARNSSVGLCPTKDQRRQRRDLGDGLCDIGAFEYLIDDASFFTIPLGNGKVAVVPL